MSGNIEAVAHRAFPIQIAGTDLEFRTLDVRDPQLTGDQVLSYADATPRESFVVLQWLEGGDIEELRPDETVDLARDRPTRFIVAETDRLFRLVLNERSISWPRRNIEEAVLRTLGEIAEDERLFVRREDVADEPIPAGGHLALADGGVEVVYARKETWKLNVQNVQIVSAASTIVVRDALVQAGFDPSQGWIIVLKTSEGKHQVSIDDVVDLRLPGIEKLRLTPREINNGEAPARERSFAILPADQAGLDARNLNWETVVDSGRRWLILRDVELPQGFNHGKATIAIEVPTTYPMAELDMFYCYPALSRLDGRPIPQTQVTEAIQGRSFQRWSRHRGGASPWRAGTDNVLTHLALVEASLLREVEP